MPFFKPIYTLCVLIATFAVLAGLSFIFPKDGIRISEQLSLHYPHYTSFLEPEKTQKADISKIIELADQEEKIQEEEIKKEEVIEETPNTSTDKIHRERNELVKDASLVQLITTIQYKNSNDYSALSNFFDALNNIDQEPKSIRILHYGDSQIEGDRISDYLRLKLQGMFGGEGPGLISFMPVAPSVVNKVSWSDQWDRYPAFAGKDKRVKHNNFGVMAQFCRFTPYKNISDTSSYSSSWIKIVTSKNGGKKASSYKKLKLFYGGAQTKTYVELYENGSLNRSDSLVAGGNFNVKDFPLNQGPLLHEFKFKGKDSPDFYGVSLESDGGVMIDNMGLRGSSGTFFNQINFGQLKQFYDYLNVKFIILQFGGNALPYIKEKKQADDFGRYLSSQIITIKKMAPQASILVIGPSDMSVKEGTEYVTHPQLENLRDAIRKAAFDNNCAFFDMYDCMGGKNSMVSWVEQKIAATDYIHFSPGGARKIATLLYSALINDYNNYLKTKTVN